MKNLLWLFLALLLIGCRDETPSGDGKFSCKINGNLFTPKFFSITSPSSNKGLSITRANNGKDLNIYATRNQEEKQIFIYVKDFVVGNFQLADSNGLPSNSSASQATIFYNGKKYLSKSGKSGSVNITTKTDTDVKGSFEFKLYSENDETDVITVKEGKFDD